MKAPFRRNRPASAEAQPTGSTPPDGTGAEQQTLLLPATPATDGAALDPPPAPAVPAAPDSAATGGRAALRRRMRYLRRAHELGLRDLGGLVFDLHRFGRRNDQLVAAKLGALDQVDAELRAIERALGQGRTVTDLHEPGVSACARCGALHGTDARFCSACGAQIAGPVAVGGPAVAPVAPAPATLAPAPAAPSATVPVPAPPVPPAGPAPPAAPLWSAPQQPAADTPESPPPATGEPAP